MRQRWQLHLSAAFFSAALYGLAAALSPAQSAADYLSIATAWLCLLFMAAALATGPVIRLRTTRVPVNHYLRRDFGIWAALTGLIHFVVATDISMDQSYLGQYVHIIDMGISAEWRNRFFSWGSMAGFVAALLLLILLALSNDRVLTWLGQARWKRLQRLAYPAFILTLAHGLAFQLIETRPILLMALLGVIGLGIAIVKLLSIRDT